MRYGVLCLYWFFALLLPAPAQSVEISVADTITSVETVGADTTQALSDAETASQATFTQVKTQILDAHSLTLGVNISLLLGHELRVALSKGMPLFFTLDLRLYQPRQWWFDKEIYKGSHTLGIRYNMLLREWRVYQNNQEFREFSLDDALKRITQLEGWVVNVDGDLEPGQSYRGEIRLRLDSSLLARPFQITALSNSSAWSFSSSWKDFSFSVQEPRL